MSESRPRRLHHLPSASETRSSTGASTVSLSFSVWTLPLRCETGQTLGLLSAFNYLYTSEVKLQHTPSTQGTGGSQSRGGSTAEERDQGLHTLARQAWRVFCSHSCSTIIQLDSPRDFHMSVWHSLQSERDLRLRSRNFLQ